ncbi:hypothetical protein BH18ACT11_BH18ACT11_20290 [soil metagenome]
MTVAVEPGVEVVADLDEVEADRALRTRVGTLNLLVPQDREGTFELGGDLPVRRLGYGAMRLP